MLNIEALKKRLAFEVMSKRRKGFASETSVKRGNRVVHGDKELIEKLGRNDPCPLRLREIVSNATALSAAVFDGANRHYYVRDKV